jgi:hypothetical protein
LFAVDEASPFHAQAANWLTEQLNGPRRVGLPWHTILGFVRISTNRRDYSIPLGPEEAWAQVERWLDAPSVWIPEPIHGHASVLGDLVRKYHVTGDLVPDAHLATLALEHGLTICSADTDFARFREVRWENPILSSG